MVRKGTTDTSKPLDYVVGDMVKRDDDLFG